MHYGTFPLARCGGGHANAVPVAEIVKEQVEIGEEIF